MENQEEKETLIIEDIDILGSIEFDLSEGIKDLICNIKMIKKDVDVIKNHLHLP
jgi:hypothetical protein